MKSICNFSKILSFLIPLSLVACMNEELAKRNPSTDSSTDAAAKTELNPDNAQVTLSSAQLMPASETSTIQVPGFSVSLSNANYVEILRCTSDYKFAVPDGTPIEKVTTTRDVRRSQMKWAWLNAKNSMSACSLVAVNSGRTTFTDLSAPAGNWRYHAVGCVSNNMLSDIQKAEPCNYEIASTNPIEYNGQLREDFLRKAQEYANVDGKLFGVLTELYRLAEKVSFETQLCIGDFQQKKFLEAMTFAAIGFIKTGLSVAATAFSGGTAAIVIGALQTTMGLIEEANKMKPQSDFSCPSAELTAKQIASFKETFTAAVDEMINIRSELNELNSGYVFAGDKVEEEFEKLKSGQSVSKGTESKK